MNTFISLLYLLISIIFIYTIPKILLPEAKKGIFDKQCIRWSRSSPPKIVRGSAAVWCGIFYIFLSILFIIAFVSAIKQFFI